MVMSSIALHTTFVISEMAIGSKGPQNRKWPMGYQMWCKAVRSSIIFLATGWLVVVIFCFFDVPLCR